MRYLWKGIFERISEVSGSRMAPNVCIQSVLWPTSLNTGLNVWLRTEVEAPHQHVSVSVITNLRNSNFENFSWWLHSPGFMTDPCRGWHVTFTHSLLEKNLRLFYKRHTHAHKKVRQMSQLLPTWWGTPISLGALNGSDCVYRPKTAILKAWFKGTV